MYFSFKKAFLSLSAILWNFAFSWLFLSLFPLPFTSLLFSAIFKPHQTTTLPFYISFSWGWFWSLPPVQCYELPTIVFQALCLSDLIPWIYLSLPLYKCKGVDLGHTWEWNFTVAQIVKNLSAMQETRLNTWVRKILWRREWQPTPVLLPRDSHGQKSLAGYSLWDCKESDMIEQLTLQTPEWPSGFPYFLKFKSEFCNKELMIWAIISCRSCFYWLYRASPSLPAKNIMNQIFSYLSDINTPSIQLQATNTISFRWKCSENSLLCAGSSNHYT